MDKQIKQTDTSIGYLVGRTSRAIMKRLSKKFLSAGFDITYEQWSILVHLFNHDGLSQQELSQMAVKDKASITRLVNALEKKNVVLRINDQLDKRSRLIYLTNKAKEFKQDLIQVVDEMTAEAQSGISMEEMESCKATLNKIFSNMSS
ncbi:MAG: MarR family transcriptional regulator [Desulfobacteraceae bacterium]|nr:MAG: MarR family transcriptional regulator [Desulfobacteraceae bacterium]